MNAFDRRDRYAAGTLALQREEVPVGAEAVFNQALTNGLLAIAVAELPEYREYERPGGRPPSARRVLRDLEARFGPAQNGSFEIPDPTSTQLGQPVVVGIRVLEDAIEATDPIRHGRPAVRALAQSDIRALLALDRHPALRHLDTVAMDVAEIKAEAQDLVELGRASGYLEVVDEVEQRRRKEALPVPFMDPSEPPGPEPLDCPVCGHPTLLSTGSDSFGYGITAGICFVCSYRRSDHAAHGENLQVEWDLHWKDL